MKIPAFLVFGTSLVYTFLGIKKSHLLLKKTNRNGGQGEGRRKEKTRLEASVFVSRFVDSPPGRW
jgi:hypothetical protein